MTALKVGHPFVWCKEVILKLEVTTIVCSKGGVPISVVYLSHSVRRSYNHTLHFTADYVGYL